MVTGSALAVDWALLMGVSPDVAFKWLQVHHIRLNLPGV